MPLRNIVRAVRTPAREPGRDRRRARYRGACCARSGPTGCSQIGLALRRWGVTPAAAFAVNAIARGPTRSAIVDDDRSLTYGADRPAHQRARERAGTARPWPRREASRSCAATGAPSSSRSWPRQSSARTLLPLNTSFAAGELAAVIEREQPPVLDLRRGVRARSCRARLADRRSRACSRRAAEDDWRPAGRSSSSSTQGSRRRRRSAPAEEGRTVILTSGTTGTPKGARLARPDGLDPLAWFLRVVPLHAGSA